MAMEVVSKNLHKHALIIAVFVGVVTLIATLALTSQLRISLTTRVVDVQPGKNGLAHIQSELPDDSATLGDSAVQAGQNANRSIIFQSAAKD